MESYYGEDSYTRNRNGTTRKIAGLGFLPVEARHGFLIEVPKGKGRNDWISIAEYRNVDLTQLESNDKAIGETSVSTLSIKVSHESGAQLASVDRPNTLAGACSVVL